mmetsp:Transcript_4576/g.8986  ORF Transcript_4576/g.8986 Transcript_4576/m.8986 type:complete len:217 (+) Transcript_4576:43-693(+)|eukprot:CAMPEP_0173390990 /NCGR_PEP_ID=MMETSP1356-20130122/16844_1 /TAXON_ID=77927 ORGANISM="Hemiselmis virescens, Strain PCC157" /NCGR_SAMPLE_ID=MMETSP1356 /ASSEMBLY_ACC=CAM_ASM_000847 /LENGTH=216 /DNA_ID=CAMNT_0014348499 /DNA_START=25 /DNA_END=675 /DNA_ORIENTATION=-
MRVVLLALAALAACTDAFVTGPALTVGTKGLVQATARPLRSSAASSIVMMGKGKGVPINQRGNAERMKQAQSMKEQMLGGDDSDGYPIFTIYVRSSVGKVWYPCGSLKGDDRSKALVESWKENSLFLKDQYKNTLDKGMAKSVFDQKDAFMQSVFRLYPQLKKTKGEIEFGFKVRIKGIEAKFEAEGRSDELKMTMLTEDMTGGLLDSMKSAFGMS